MSGFTEDVVLTEIGSTNNPFDYLKKGQEGYTSVLHWALEQNETNVIDAVLGSNLKADDLVKLLQLKSKSGSTPIGVAELSTLEYFLEKLEESSFDLMKILKEANILGQVAAEANSKKIKAVLNCSLKLDGINNIDDITVGTNIDKLNQLLLVKDTYGDPLLHKLVYDGNSIAFKEIMKLLSNLSSKGIDISPIILAPGEHRFTVLDVVFQKGSEGIIKDFLANITPEQLKDSLSCDASGKKSSGSQILVSDKCSNGNFSAVLRNSSKDQFTAISSKIQEELLADKDYADKASIFIVESTKGGIVFDFASLLISGNDISAVDAEIVRLSVAEYLTNPNAKLNGIKSEDELTKKKNDVENLKKSLGVRTLLEEDAVETELTSYEEAITEYEEKFSTEKKQFQLTDFEEQFTACTNAFQSAKKEGKAREVVSVLKNLKDSIPTGDFFKKFTEKVNEKITSWKEVIDKNVSGEGERTVAIESLAQKINYNKQLAQAAKESINAYNELSENEKNSATKCPAKDSLDLTNPFDRFCKAILDYSNILVELKNSGTCVLGIERQCDAYNVLTQGKDYVFLSVFAGLAGLKSLTPRIFGGWAVDDEGKVRDFDGQVKSVAELLCKSTAESFMDLSIPEECKVVVLTESNKTPIICPIDPIFASASDDSSCSDIIRCYNAQSSDEFNNPAVISPLSSNSTNCVGGGMSAGLEVHNIADFFSN